MNNQSYAQNYPQLFNQAIALKYSDEELRLLKKAFDFAQQFSHGVYRAQGIPLINHLVRTASIVMHNKQAISLVIVSLLHAVYVIHKFDHSVRTAEITSRSEELVALFGHDINQLIIAYEELHWYKQEEIKAYLAQAERLPQQTKDLILIRLANELEDHLDLAMSYSSDERIQRRSFAYGYECVELAKHIGFIDIGEQIKSILDQQKEFFPAEFLRVTARQGYEISQVKWPKTLLEKIKSFIKSLLKK
ncbi:hypothetical protein tinsulaeT_26390 [Thalassotalea insulae]|uniref:HD domain-containing protein n=1 Tax=Thalassotalea insulae TaxID=2056778 RepID=A0ABQ6GVR6_9GAMM|nr:hypothetical protein [Thalassotalea insulae]GLX79299.1 hypothetical protein tinsulaeT_26390 [Thalassotalea insulae]